MDELLDDEAGHGDNKKKYCKYKQENYYIK
jgi:hypothetical protein